MNEKIISEAAMLTTRYHKLHIEEEQKWRQLLEQKPALNDFLETSRISFARGMAAGMSIAWRTASEDLKFALRMNSIIEKNARPS